MASVQALLAKLRRPSTAADSDRMLLARFAATGDDSAFSAIVARHGPLVLGVCRRTIRDSQLAEDAFQAVFLVLARKAAGVSVRESLANWLYVVARRVAVKAAKRRQADPVVPTTDRAEASSDAADLVGAIDEELDRLPDKYRSPVLAVHLQGRTQDEAAELLGWSLSTVRRRLAAGRELLRNRLTARGVTLGSTAFLATVPVSLAAAATAEAVAVRAGAIIGPHLLPLVNEGLRMGSGYWKVGGFLAAAAVAVGVAVSNGEEKPKEPIAAPAVVAKWTTITGRVVWPGDPPKAKVEVNSDKEHCLSKGPLEADEVIVNKKTGGLKNVWVYLRPDDDDREAKFKDGQVHPDLLKPKAVEHEVDQPCCQFIPRMLAVRAGDTMKFKNSSPIPHNVKFDGASHAAFNVTMPSGQAHATGPLAAHRHPNTFACSIHRWMAGSFMAFDHPYFALTDADGKFEIKHAPQGKFRIVYRHETGYHKGRDGGLGFPIEVQGSTMELDPLKYEQPSR
jgi:RNA polymerase sigma factor (sigma-70 family)